jgi:hypothetical protein
MCPSVSLPMEVCRQRNVGGRARPYRSDRCRMVLSRASERPLHLVGNIYPLAAILALRGVRPIKRTPCWCLVRARATMSSYQECAVAGTSQL